MKFLLNIFFIQTVDMIEPPSIAFVIEVTGNFPDYINIFTDQQYASFFYLLNTLQ